MEPLNGKVALVTGGSSGIGFAITKALLKEGMRVAICGRDKEKLRRAEVEFKGYGKNLMARAADVAKRPEVERWVKGAVFSC